jgi:hypothetical protein
MRYGISLQKDVLEKLRAEKKRTGVPISKILVRAFEEKMKRENYD